MFFFQSDEIFKSTVSPGRLATAAFVAPNIAAVIRRRGDSDDSIKHRNGERRRVDVAERRRLMILNQRGAPAAGTAAGRGGCGSLPGDFDC